MMSSLRIFVTVSVCDLILVVQVLGSILQIHFSVEIIQANSGNAEQKISNNMNVFN